MSANGHRAPIQLTFDDRSVLDRFADAVIAADTDDRIVYANEAAERLLGWPVAELVGAPLTRIQPSRFHAAHLAGLARYRDTGVARLIGATVRVPALRRDGTEVEVELSLSTARVGADGDELFIGALRDPDALVELERHRTVSRYLRAATEAAAAFSTRGGVDDVLRIAVDALVAGFDAALARVWLHDPTTATLHLRASAGLPVEGDGVSATVSLDDAPGALGQAARTRRPLVRHDPAADPAFPQPWPRDEQIAAVAAYPLLAGDNLRGVLLHVGRVPLAKDAAAALASFAAIVGAALNDAESLERERVARAEAEAAQQRAASLAEAGVALATALDEPTVLATVARLLVPNVADGCIFDLLADNGTDGTARRAVFTHASAVPAAGGDDRPAWARALETDYPIDPTADDNLVVRVLRSGQSQLLPDVPDEVLVASARDQRHAALLRSFGIRSTIVVPLVARERVLGAVTLATTTSGRRYGLADLTFAEDLARRVALALANARLFAAEQSARRGAERAIDRAARLQAVTAALSEASTPAQVAAVVVDQGVAALGARAGSVALLAPAGGELEVAAAVGYPAEVIAAWRRFPLAAPVPLADAVRAAEPVWLESENARAARYPHLAVSGTDGGDRALAALPLVVDGRAVGAMGLTFDAARPFAEEERGFALALARQCAQALDRARLYEAERAARATAEAAQRRTAILAEASQAFAAARLDLADVLDAAARHTVAAVGDGCIVRLVSDDATEFLPAAAYHPNANARSFLWDLLRTTRHPVGEGLVGRVFASGEPLLIPELPPAEMRAALKPEYRPFLDRFGLHGALVAPIRGQDGVIGTLMTWRDTPGRPYTGDDLAFLAGLADRAAAAIENARLFREQVEARARVQALAAERALTLGQIADGVIAADIDGRITFVNEAARRLHGVAELGVGVDDYTATYHLLTMDGEPYPPEDLPLAHAVLHGATVVDAEWRIRRPDGTEIVAQGSAAPVLADDGGQVGAVLTLRDVTAQRAFQRQKDEFFVTASHDLRTPLTGIKGWAQLLHQRGVRAGAAPRDLQALAAIEAQANGMHRLLEQMLDASRLQLGDEVELRFTAVDLLALVTRLVAQFRALTDRHELRVLAPGPVQGVWDAARVEQILANLLGNAIKFSPAGGPIDVAVEQDDHEARVAVSDAGIGIPAADVDRVFEQFYRAGNATGDPETMHGLGLGLFSARRLAALHGGHLAAASDLGRGSTFTLVLPLDSSSTAHPLSPSQGDP